MQASELELIKKYCPEYLELVEKDKKASFPPWIVDDNFNGDNWLICSTGNAFNGKDYSVTTDRQRGSETNFEADAQTDSEMIAASRNAVMPMLKALTQTRAKLESQKDIVDAAIEWQSYWSDNIHDRDGINRRQGYLYDRVRRYKQAVAQTEVVK